MATSQPGQAKTLEGWKVTSRDEDGKIKSKALHAFPVLNSKGGIGKSDKSRKNGDGKNEPAY